jgi:DNA-directed RNA polymerase subunit F
MSNREAYELVLKYYEPGKPPLVAPYRGAYNYLVQSGQIEPIKKRQFYNPLIVEVTEREKVVEYLENLTKKA